MTASSWLQDFLLTFCLAASSLFTVFILTLPRRFRDDDLLESSNSAARSRLSSRRGSDGSSSINKVSVQIVVLGDIGRSPRMQYHAMSLVKHGAQVQIVGYEESDMHGDLKHANLQVVPLPPSPKLLQTSNKLLFLLLAPIKVIWQILSLYYVLGYKTEPTRWMLVQNPPSIPTLAVAYIVCFFRNTKLVIDWHNFGYSILALKLGSAHPVVRVSKTYEETLGSLATAHITVTRAMANVLERDVRIKALPLHDRPPAHFQPLSQDQRWACLQRLQETADKCLSILTGKTRLLVSSTSWTADEDFSLLLDALVHYAKVRKQDQSLPEVLAIITGKGPQKSHYLARIEALKSRGDLPGITIRTAWLSMADYALLLGSADLGVSLHTSSSGVDLPMKVVDMFGTGLPVLGWGEFEAWPELVTEGVNGRGFGSAGELSDLLVQVLAGDGAELQKLRQGARNECAQRWDDEWDPTAGRLFGVVK